MSLSRFKLPLIGVAVLASAGLVAWQAWSARAAPVPPGFDAAATLDAALAQSTASGKPVLALLTADWCGPCQQYKRGALAHPKVAEWVRDNTVGVYVDVDAHPADATRLNAYSIPTLVLIRPDGSRPARFEGNRSAEDLLSFLHAAAPPTPAAP